MKKFITIKQTLTYRASVELTEEQLREIKKGNFIIHYMHVDEHSKLNVEVETSDSEPDESAIVANVEQIFDID